MNYRHIYHAGNFADVFKHVLLARMLAYIVQKPAPLRYIDTHAGIGRYDLGRDEAARTGEWRTGIGRLARAAAPSAVAALLAPYLDAIGACDGEGRPVSYPGSPAIAQAILRPTDRLTLAERHPDDIAALRRAVRNDERVTVVADDGYRMLNAAVPPPERRGLVFIDPPFEAVDEGSMLVEALARALRKWASGTYAVWYPVKNAAAATALRQKLAALAPERHCSLTLARPGDAALALRGCGLFVINPPYGLVAEAPVLLPYLGDVLSDPALPRFQTRYENRAGSP